MATPNLLTLQDAVAEGYGGYSTLRKYIATGQLAASKVGARIKVQRADLDALLEPATPPRTVEDVESAIARIVATAPPLSDEQISILGATFVERLRMSSVERPHAHVSITGGAA